MLISPLLSFYIVRNFLLSFGAVFLGFIGVIFLFDTIELLRRAGSSDNISLGLILQMSLLRLLFLVQQAFPLAVLFGGMIGFWRLTRSRELVVTRSAGVSAWQFLLPVILISAVLGALSVTVVNPMASALLAKYERLNESYFEGRSRTLSISGSGLWLRQANVDSRSVIHAPDVSIDGPNVSLTNVTIFVFDGSDTFKSRIQASKGKLEDGFWHLTDVRIHESDKPARLVNEHWFETDLTLNNIQDSFSPPETMSFWELPSFIANLDKAGFSAIRHRLHWHSLMAVPLLFVGMVLIAAVFTLRLSARGSTTFIILGGILSGFLLFIFSDIVFALGLRESVPVALAAWTPAGVCTLLGMSMLFHLEDG